MQTMTNTGQRRGTGQKRRNSFLLWVIATALVTTVTLMTPGFAHAASSEQLLTDVPQSTAALPADNNVVTDVPVSNDAAITSAGDTQNATDSEEATDKQVAIDEDSNNITATHNASSDSQLSDATEEPGEVPSDSDTSTIAKNEQVHSSEESEEDNDSVENSDEKNQDTTAISNDDDQNSEENASGEPHEEGSSDTAITETLNSDANNTDIKKSNADAAEKTEKTQSAVKKVSSRNIDAISTQADIVVNITIHFDKPVKSGQSTQSPVFDTAGQHAYGSDHDFIYDETGTRITAASGGSGTYTITVTNGVANHGVKRYDIKLAGIVVLNSVTKKYFYVTRNTSNGKFNTFSQLEKNTRANGARWR